jgi:hypothetical protein
MPTLDTRKRKTARRKPTVIYTKPFMSDGKEYHGRLPNGRVSLNQKENANCIKMLRQGLGHQTIANELQMTLSQVQYRAKMAKVSVMAFRRGESQEAKVILRRFTVRYKH